MASELQNTFALNWDAYYPKIDLHTEHVFASPRRFRFDFANLESKVAIEIQGGIFNQNTRHINGAALVKEHEKLNLAASMGWRIFYVNCKSIDDKPLYDLIATTILSD